MRLTNDMWDDAMQRAQHVLRASDDEGQWTAFRELLEGEAARTREEAVHMLCLELVCNALVPGVDRTRWARLGWNRVLAGEVSAAGFVHELRLARAAGSARGKL